MPAGDSKPSEKQKTAAEEKNTVGAADDVISANQTRTTQTLQSAARELAKTPDEAKTSGRTDTTSGTALPGTFEIVAKVENGANGANSVNNERTVTHIAYPDQSSITISEDTSGRLISAKMRDGKMYYPDDKSLLGQCKAADGSKLDYIDVFPEQGGTVHYEKNGVEYTLEPSGNVSINNPENRRALDFKAAPSDFQAGEGQFRISADGTCHKLVTTENLENELAATIEQFRQTRKQIGKLAADVQSPDIALAVNDASALLLQLRENLTASRYPEEPAQTLRRMAHDFNSQPDTQSLLINAASVLDSHDYLIGGKPQNYLGGTGAANALRDSLEFSLGRERPAIQQALQVVEDHVRGHAVEYPALGTKEYAMKSKAREFEATQERLLDLARASSKTETATLLNSVANHLTPYYAYLQDAEGDGRGTKAAAQVAHDQFSPALRSADDGGTLESATVDFRRAQMPVGQATSLELKELGRDSDGGDRASRFDLRSAFGIDLSTRSSESKVARYGSSAFLPAGILATSIFSMFAKPTDTMPRRYFIPVD